MRYMCLVKGPEIPMDKVPPALMQAIGALTAESMQSGEFVLAGGWNQPPREPRSASGTASSW